MKAILLKPNWLHHRAFGLFLAASASVIFSRIMIWITDENMIADYDFWELSAIILGSCLEDLLVCIAVFSVYQFFHTIVSNAKYKLVVNSIYSILLLSLIIFCALNALSIVRMGFPVSTGWWPYLNADYLTTLQTSGHLEQCRFRVDIAV